MAELFPQVELFSQAKIVPLSGSAENSQSGYHYRMSNESIPPKLNWFVREWIRERGHSIAWFEEKTGWTHRITSQRVNLKKRWDCDQLKLAAEVLEVEPYELLIHPSEAKEIQRMRESLRQAAARILDESPSD